MNKIVDFKPEVKMSTHLQSVAELTRRGKNALINELGIVDTMRFLNQFRASNGDYTKDRNDFLRKETVRSLVADVKALRKNHIFEK